MARTPRRAAAAMAAVAALAIAGCGGDDGDADAPATTDAATAPATTAPPATAPATTTGATTGPAAAPDPGLPDETAGFRSWLRVNDAPIPPNAGAPHGETKNVYVNRERSEVRGRTPSAPYPDGTVVVKTGSRGDDLAAIVAVMSKRADADPQHGDWVFVEYARTSADEEYTVLARDSVCWGCHAGATDKDWVFTGVD